MKLILGIIVLLLFNLQASFSQKEDTSFDSVPMPDYCKNDRIEFSSQTEKLIIKGRSYKNIDGFSFCVNNKDTVSFDGRIYLIVPNPKHDILAVFISYENLKTEEDNIMAEAVYFYFVESNEALKYRAGEDFDFFPVLNIWSCKGTYACFSIGFWSGYEVVETKKMKNYLTKGKGQIYITAPIRENDPVKVHNFYGWINDHEFDFTGTCCATTFYYRYNMKAEKVRIIWEGDYLILKSTKNRYRG